MLGNVKYTKIIIRIIIYLYDKVAIDNLLNDF